MTVTFDPSVGGRPPTATTPRARPPAQLAVGALWLWSIGLVALPHAPDYLVGTAVATGIGVTLALATPFGRRFDALPTPLLAPVAAIFTIMGIGALAAFGLVLSPQIALGVGFVVLGLGWGGVPALRTIALASAVPVVIGCGRGEAWVYPAAIAWLAILLGSLTLIEADLRAGTPPLEPLIPGATAGRVSPRESTPTMLVAIGIGLALALLMAAPSCQRMLRPSGRSSGEGTPRPGTGGTPGGGDHRYVPDPDGRWLIPGDGDGTGPLIPRPEDGEGLVPGGTRRFRPDPSTTVTYRRRVQDGDLSVSVHQDGRPTRVYREHRRPDGTWDITVRDADGHVIDRYRYDPEGRVQRGDRATPATTTTQPAPPKATRRQHRSIRWWQVLLALAVLAAVVALVVWLARRRPPDEAEPDGPPWVIDLTRRLERFGRLHGRARRPSETLVAYGAAVAAGPVPDPRVEELVALLSAVLFSRRGPDDDARVRATALIDGIEADHPVDDGHVGRRRNRTDRDQTPMPTGVT